MESFIERGNSMIKVQNIYYMLSYAFQVLREQDYGLCDVEEFEHTAELLAEILIKGLTFQIKRGLNRQYRKKEERDNTIRGKINVGESVRPQTIVRRKVVCEYDIFSFNTYENQVIKATCISLLQSDLSKNRKGRLKKLMVFLEEVELLQRKKIDWKFPHSKCNRNYQMLLSICYLIMEGLLQTEEDGCVYLKKFLDEQRMCRLYEKFLLEYYRIEMPMITTTSSRIQWQLDDDYDYLLPIMQSDIVLSYKNKTLIIDAKYYEQPLQIQERYQSYTIHSSNLYQIFSYVKNKDIVHDGSVAGMLLYAKTQEDSAPNVEYKMSGNRIFVRSLDLNLPFEKIKEQLEKIAMDYFQIH